MSYVVLARKWRPSQFQDIVGQGHIVRTLANAVQKERLHQAYLFTGSRGIGKTSIARIFAKVVRCQATSTEGEQNWMRSCDECASCKEITNTNGVDVIEIDGASNNGVDAVREIRENAKYMPSTGSKKVYIIDEVHMLTTAAFNALLKTLEEPPAHVIFILATTEPHKIPATILSRCQRFDFKRVTVAQIQERLEFVLGQEKIEFEKGCLSLIARASEGSMRDALSLLDQVIAYSGDKISIQSVRESIGLIEGQTIIEILKGILAKKPQDALAQVEKAYQQGHDLKFLTRHLIEYLHGVILAKAGIDRSATLELSEDEWNEVKELSELRELEELELIFQVLHLGMDSIARSSQPKILLDVLLIKCATAEALIRVGDLNSNNTQQKMAASNAVASMSTATPSTPVSSNPAVSAKPPAPQSAPSPAPSVTAQFSQQVHQKPAATPNKPATTPTWEGFISVVRSERPLLASLLEHAIAHELPSGSDKGLKIFYKPEDAYKCEQLQARVYADQTSKLAMKYFGDGVFVKISTKQVSGESLADKKVRIREEKEKSAQDAVQNHPVIQEAKALFGGKLGPIDVTGAP